MKATKQKQTEQYKKDNENITTDHIEIKIIVKYTFKACTPQNWKI